MNSNAITSASFSVIVPVYACESCLHQLCVQLEDVMKILTDQFEIIFVDDRSQDNSWVRILSLQSNFPSIKGIRLSRNYGQQIAITAGLAEARGDYAIVMDCDLQDPPSLIPVLYAKLREGYDLVFAKRVTRTHSAFRQLAAKLYFKMLSMVTEEQVDGSYGSFSILSRKVINSFLLFEERERHYLFILRWLGYRIGTVNYHHQERYSGQSSYDLVRLVRHGISGVFFQSTVILRWSITAGFVLAFLGILLATYFLWRYLFRTSLPGWTSLIVLILISTGIILISQGVIGLYIGRIFDQTKRRPLYIIDIISESSHSW